MVDIAKKYVFTLLNIENLVTDYVDSVEKYYIQLAKNMSLILDSLKHFFKK